MSLVGLRASDGRLARTSYSQHRPGRQLLADSRPTWTVYLRLTVDASQPSVAYVLLDPKLIKLLSTCQCFGNPLGLTAAA
jgi:hypothetical protein